MRIKRFFAPDVRRAINMVRSEFGPDAVILSNTRVDGGVEIISAVDYDERLYDAARSEASSSVGPASVDQTTTASAASTNRSVTPASGESSRAKVMWDQDPALTEMGRQIKSMRSLLESQLSKLAWDELEKRSPQKAQLIQRLGRLDLGSTLCRKIAGQIGSNRDVEKMWHQALATLAHLIPIVGSDIVEDGGIIALVGPTGVGKTTTIAKLAARYALKHGRQRVALVTTDNYRIGAYEQLSAYGRILDVPVRMATGPEELRNVIEDFYSKDLILLDTAGMGQRDLRLSQQLEVIRAGLPAVSVYLVAAAGTRFAGMEEIMHAFRGPQVKGAIVTKLDEATGLGGVITSVIKHNLPIAYIGSGQRVPEDIYVARGHTLVSQAVAIMRQLGRLLDEEGFNLMVDKAGSDARIQ